MYVLIVILSVLLFSIVVGYFLISRVPPLLHTPLMSMTNAISAVTLLGAFLIFAVASDTSAKVVGAAAVVLAAFNVVGGFVITERMLKLFKSR